MKFSKIDKKGKELTNPSHLFNQNINNVGMLINLFSAFEQEKFFRQMLVVLFIFFFTGLQTLNAQTIVNPGDDLNSIIQNTSGETIIINSGIYGPLLINDKNFTATNPLIIKAAEGANVKIEREGQPKNWELTNPHTGSRDAAVFTRCSYIAFDNIKFSGGSIQFTGNDRGVWIHSSNHLIFRNCEFTETQQEGVKVEANSEYIDFIGCLFANTGLGPNPWHGEGLYIGRGSYNGYEHLFPDVTKYVWVEGCEFYNTGKSEAINIKAEVFSCTVRNNYIHNITLNDRNDLVHRQTNEAAISLDHNIGVNRGTSSEPDWETYRKGDRRENWVENNTIITVRTGQTTIRPNGESPTPRIAGIYSAGTGNNIVGNTVSDVKNDFIDYSANGIRLNNWRADITKNYVWNNSVINTDDGNYFGNLAIEQNPETNPNSAQSWYFDGNNNGNNNANIVVSAKGENGDEKIRLLLDDVEVQTWEVSNTSYQNFNYNGAYNGQNIKVEFFNDASGRNIMIDYIEVDGQRKEAEDQYENTGVWQNQCGGHYAERLSCNGYINFSSTSQEDATANIVVSAKGENGEEQIRLLLDDVEVQNWDVTNTSYQNFNYNGAYNGQNIKVEFFNDASGRNIMIDYIEVDGQRKEAEDQYENTGVWQNQCGGHYAERLSCNGYINFNSYTSNRVSSGIEDTTNLFNNVSIYPNPSSGFVNLTLNAIKEGNYIIQVINIAGKLLLNDVIDIKSNTNTFQLNLNYLAGGLYMLQLNDGTRTHLQKINIAK